MNGLRAVRRHGADYVADVLDNMGKRNLWKRMLKNTMATTAAVSICLIPGAKTTVGKAAYLAAMATVFGHPGRRFGQMAEALTLAVSGTLIGLAWSLLGVYLGSLIVTVNPPAAYAIRGLFFAVVLMLHGFWRSYAPRLFVGLVLLIVVSAVTLLSTAKQVTQTAATQILYPILIAAGVILVVNLFVFPEFSSGFLGQVTIETLDETANALENAGHFFSQSNGTIVRKEEQKFETSGGETSNSQERSLKMSDSGHNESTLDQPGSPDFAKAPKANSLSNQASTLARSLTQKFEVIARQTDKPTERAVAIEKLRTLSLSALTSLKGSLRQKLTDCKTAQNECNFEIAYSVLPPRELKPVSTRSMTKLFANTIAIISTCESKFALVGDSVDSDAEAPSNVEDENSDEQEADDINKARAELELIKPRREIEFGDVRLLRFLLRRIEKPYTEMSTILFKHVTLINSCIAYVYGVSKLPSGARAPKHIAIEEVDEALNNLRAALEKFEVDTRKALQSAAVQQELEGFEPDIMPREEIFLISSFLLNFSQAAGHIQDMLKHSRNLVDERQQRRGHRRLYAPRIKWATWLFSGGEQDEALPPSGRKENRQGVSNKLDAEDFDDDSSQSRGALLKGKNQEDLEQANKKHDVLSQERNSKVAAPTKAVKRGESPQKQSTILRLRGKLADLVEWTQGSDDLLYALKLTVAVFLVTWPAFVARWNTWYSLNRGLWAALQLIFVTEVSIGTSVWTFFIRGIGTTLGCLWGWAAWEARNGEPIVCAVMICLGVIPSTYVQLGSKHPKAGMVSIISMCVVALSTELGTVPGTATENFLKRYIAFMIGGIVALIVEMVLLPVKARTRLVESIAAALRQISEMENAIAAGIEEGVNLTGFGPDRVARCEHASGKVNRALDAAEVFLSFCSSEPRVKGSFQGAALIYNEIIFVLHQVVDRMDNMLTLRTAYGSGPLEEFNAQIYPYRRNVAGSIMITLFAIHGALTCKMPLPQFLPSARLAHLRMINRVREVVLESVAKGQKHDEQVSKLAPQLALRRKYMAWNAASAAQAEIIEFLEELIDLTKMIVGANEFRTGLLTRPTHHEYSKDTRESQPAEPLLAKPAGDAAMDSEGRDEFRAMAAPGTALRNRRRRTTSASEVSDEIPASYVGFKAARSRRASGGSKPTIAGIRAFVDKISFPMDDRAYDVRTINEAHCAACKAVEKSGRISFPLFFK